MHSLNLPFDAASRPKILCLGAHSDDIEIGCGGAVLRLAQQYPNCLFHWVVFSALGVRAAEAQRGATFHQDHRLISELTWNTFRDHFILEYEIPKYDGDLGHPNLFVPVGYEMCEQKVRYLMDAFESQRSKRWFQPETFFSLMRLRGMECNAPSGYAEAFYSRKLVL